MTEIYWLTRIGALNTMFHVMWIVPLVVGVITFIMGPIFLEAVYEDNKATCDKWAKRLIASAIIGLLGVTFTPSQKEMLLIYGLGSTVDYIKSNDQAKQLPDKAVEALTRYLDEISNDKKDK